LAEIRNPNQPGGGGQDSRTLLIFSIVFVLIFLGLQYFGPKKKTAPETPAEVASSTAPRGAVNPASAMGAGPGSAGSASSGTASAVLSSSVLAKDAVVASAETSTVVENELYRITFSNRGGQATSWILKKYKDEAGKPLDLVNPKAAAKVGYPLSLWAYDANLRNQLAQALYVASATGRLTAPGTLSFTYSNNGLEVKKVFSFDSSYVLHVDVTAADHGNPVTALVSWPGGFGDQETLPDFAASQFDTMQGGKDDRQAAKKIAGGGTLPGPFEWAGVSDLYFAAIFLPDAPSQTLLVGLHDSLDVPRHGKTEQTDPASVLGAAMGATSGHSSLRLYAGPKVLDVLASVRATTANGTQTGPNLEAVVNFGYAGIIAKPLFLALRWIHEHIVSNWGWAILVLTLIINLAMLPTRIQMMRSALKMQRIQPEMNSIKEKYKKYKATDPRRADMNKEMFDLQKREGVNMFGGCLPMLVQWPLLFAFYRMLLNTIELRQAPWLWLHNLAAPDPLHILPVFFIVTMFLVQYLTPSPGMDPAQQKMMAFTMPVFFGFMTWNLSSGLALYWAFGNVINVIQQAVMNRTGIGKQMREIAAKRAAKRSGGKQPNRKPSIEPRRRPEIGG
jgi:YidC/Oxa1 family membrane protein insertase